MFQTQVPHPTSNFWDLAPKGVENSATHLSGEYYEAPAKLHQGQWNTDL